MTKKYPLIISCLILIFTLTISGNKANAQSLTLQSSFNSSNPTNGLGGSGILYFGNEYWVAKFSQDSVYRLTTSGTLIEGFVITGVSGIRSLTTDGTSLYAGLSTTTIAKINPATKTLVGTITAPIITKFVTYSPSANSGAGGLWIGDGGTDFYLISLTGTVLTTISSTQHRLTSVYGLAYDAATSNGGPFLWAFDQGPAGNGASLVRIPIATGTPDYSYNVNNDFPMVVGGVAGGVNLSSAISPGQRVLVALLQGTPNMVALYTVPIVLPITYVNFSGERKGSKNLLKWTTATEQNNQGFDLQRSADGNQFKTIAFIASKAINGNSISNINYSINDELPLKGNNYYRLVQVDKDGRRTISGTVILKAGQILKAEISRIFPNPVTSVLNVSVNTPADSKLTFIVTDMKGTMLIKQVTQTNAGNNLFPIQVRNLAAGTYVLKAITNDGQSVGETKFVK